MRSEAQLAAELEALDDYLTRIVGVEPDPAQALRVVTDLVRDRVDGVLFQRWRDWPVSDLIALMQRIEARLPAAAPKKRKAPSAEAAL